MQKEKREREIKRKLHNGFLWIVTYSAFILFIISLASIESESRFPTVAAVVSIAWLLLFSLVNKDRW